MNLYLPDEIKKIVEGTPFNIDNIGRSSDQVIIFEDKYVLKISSDHDRLKKEYEINKYLEGKIKCSKNILLITENNKTYYLRTCINGYSLIHNKYISNPHLLIEALVKTVKILRSLDNDQSFNIKSHESSGNSFTHGDLCLPNIYFDDNNEFIGFIDLNASGLGDPWIDYAWMLWSLEYNLKTTKYHHLLLEKLNIKFDIDKYNYYIPVEYQK